MPVEHFGNKLIEQIKTDIESADMGLKVTVFPASRLSSSAELLEAAATAISTRSTG